jgi:hypothetical protein
MISELSDLICSDSFLYSLVINKYFNNYFYKIVINIRAAFIFIIGYG